MRLFADENMARAIVNRLRERGHDVLYAPDVQPGASDTIWLDLAEAEGRIILTTDKDFGDLVFRDRLSSRGIILLRLDNMPLAARLARLERAWASAEVHSIGKMIVISPNKIRVRDLLA